MLSFINAMSQVATIMHELRSKEFNLLFHGSPMKDKVKLLRLPK